MLRTVEQVKEADAHCGYSQRELPSLEQRGHINVIVDAICTHSQNTLDQSRGMVRGGNLGRPKKMRATIEDFRDLQPRGSISRRNTAEYTRSTAISAPVRGSIC